MYLKKLSIEHFRKFGDANNTIQFAASKDYKEEKYLNIAPKTTLIVGKNNSGKTTIVEVLRRLLEQTDFRATDFNFDYLQTLLISYTPRRLKNGKIKFPTMKFVLTIGVLQIKVNRFCRKSPKKYSADSRVKMRTANRTPSKIGGSQMA